MQRLVFGLALGLVSALVLAAEPTAAQTWPQRPVRFIVTLGAGSGVDIGTRLIADIPLAADPNHIGAELQSWRDRVIDAALDLVQRDAGNVLTGRNENISIRIRGGVVRRGKFSRKLIGGIDERVIEVEEPWRGLLLHPFRQTTLFSLVFLD